MSRIEERAKTIAKAAKDAAIARGVEEIERAIGDELPVVVSAVEQGIELKGRGLLRRLVRDPRLRWIGRLLR
ncbi:MULTISPECIES: hypothetical protein [unclassified Sphingomonas]|uniref:hypothetical protein n=1 Tax=unclassified Sphingomonas TaxID=196159 RepID=UPI000BC8E1E4|nr:MAG: hypothetical protein B7Y98_05240 [Sphingomonas sp. 32-62-10]OYY64957.1 MAG: hypothetical protein B7Y49_07690 [Sphingomonas sp. 28-62-11]